MMTTPGNFSLYKKLGIEAVALYYSATPFDAFRVFSRPLTRAQAHNPILYKHPVTGEEMTIIPSYHIGDLVEHVSLRSWVEELRTLQEKGALKRDALIFINFDADSEFWSGVDVPWPLRWMPNARGLGALVRSVKDLPYVRFTGLDDYLHSHPPVDTFYFSQDTADGSFNGYNSWAEKARVSPQWTSIERSRRIEAAVRKAAAILGRSPELADVPPLTEAAELIRLRALSTTNFGMATPYVSPQREKAVADLIARLDRHSDAIEKHLEAAVYKYLRDKPPPKAGGNRLQWLDTFLLLKAGPAGHSGGRFIRLNLEEKTRAGGPFMLAAPDGRMLEAIPWGNGHDRWLQLYLPDADDLPDGVYYLYRNRTSASIEGNGMHADKHSLSNGIIELRFDDAGQVEGIYLNGVRQAEPGSLEPYLRYDQRVVRIEGMKVEQVASVDRRSASVRLSGVFPVLTGAHLPAGKAVYTISVLPGRPYLLLHGEITYPESESDTTLKADTPALSRRIDRRWREVAPAEIRFAPCGTRQNPPSVLKRNFLDVESRYALDYFHLSPDNLNLDDVNNHITASYMGIVSGGYGLAIAMDTSVQANFAFAPLKMTYDPRKDAFEVRANPFGTYYGRQYRPPTWGNGEGYDMTLYTGEHLHSAAPTYNGFSQTFDLLISFFKGERINARLKGDLLAYSHPPLMVSLDGSSDERVPQPQLGKPADFAAARHADAMDFSRNPGDSSPARHRLYFSMRETEPLKYPDIPLHLKMKVLWSNVRALIEDF